MATVANIDTSYAVLISYIDPNDRTNTVSIVLDTVNESSVTVSSTVTEHPTVDGTPIADHMYRNPTDVSISGVFSLNGKKAFVIDKAGRSLARVEKMFEDLKDNGALCAVTKIKVIGSQQMPQFTVRQNMVLQSITWVEKTNSLGFTFNFKEALRADIQEAEVDPDDEFAPAIDYADASNFSDTLLDWDEIDKEVLDALREYNLCPDEFIEMLGSWGVASLVAIGVAAAIASVVTGLVTLTLTGLIGIAVAIVAVFVIGIMALIKAIKKRSYKIEAFKVYSNATKQEKEVRRFCDFYEQVHNQIRSLDGVIKVYSVTENKNQEAIVSIDSSYYIFEFEKINTGSDWTVIVSDINDKVLVSTTSSCAKSSYTACTKSNYLFKTSSSYIYLIRPNGVDASDLTNYFICVSQINPEDFSQALTDIIQNAIKY